MNTHPVGIATLTYKGVPYRVMVNYRGHINLGLGKTGPWKSLDSFNDPALKGRVTIVLKKSPLDHVCPIGSFCQICGKY